MGDDAGTHCTPTNHTLNTNPRYRSEIKQHKLGCVCMCIIKILEIRTSLRGRKVGRNMANKSALYYKLIYGDCLGHLYFWEGGDKSIPFLSYKLYSNLPVLLLAFTLFPSFFHITLSLQVGQWRVLTKSASATSEINTNASACLQNPLLCAKVQ